MTDTKKNPAPWSPEENAALVALYFAMLDAAIAGRHYIKAVMIRNAQSKGVNGGKPTAHFGQLTERSRASIEFKLMNATAAHQSLSHGAAGSLDDATEETMHGYGYRAMPNYQATLKLAMRDELAERKDARARALGIRSTAPRHGAA